MQHTRESVKSKLNQSCILLFTQELEEQSYFFQLPVLAWTPQDSCMLRQPLTITEMGIPQSPWDVFILNCTLIVLQIGNPKWEQEVMVEMFQTADKLKTRKVFSVECRSAPGNPKTKYLDVTSLIVTTILISNCNLIT